MRAFYAIIGHPVAHSLSPLFQQAAFDALGIEAAYLPFDIPPESLPEGLAALKTLNVSGFNVTLPHKEALLPLMDQLTDAARQIRAVNAVLSDNGMWVGHNTDGPGFEKALMIFLERNRIVLPTHGVIFGAGGSARAVLWALARIGLSHLCLVNRSLERASLLLRTLSGKNQPALAAFALDDPAWKEWLKEAARPLLVNTLSLHAFDRSFGPLESVDLSRASALVDLSYTAPMVPGRENEPFCQEQTPFLRMGDPFGIPRQNGVGMLLWQGVLSFEFWTGLAAPVAIMEEKLLERTGLGSLY